MLTGIDRPTSGRILFAGQELRALSEDGLARWRGKHVGIVFQFFQLIPTLTALENVLLALELGGAGGLKRRRGRSRAMICLELAHIENLAHRLPSELSGGEQQRVAIARALANDPPVIVADEPTGNLDSRTAQQIFTVLAELTQYNKIVIYVTHARDLANRASARIELLDGHIATTLAQQPGIEKFQIRNSYSTAWQIAGKEVEHTLDVFTFTDIEHIQLWPFQLVQGHMPGPGEIVLDMKNGIEGYPVAIGDTISIQTPNTHFASLRVSGLSRTRGFALGGMFANPMGYMNLETLQRLASSSASISPPAPRLVRNILVQTPDAVIHPRVATRIVRELESNETLCLA